MVCEYTTILWGGGGGGFRNITFYKGLVGLNWDRSTVDFGFFSAVLFSIRRGNNYFCVRQTPTLGLKPPINCILVCLNCYEHHLTCIRKMFTLLIHSQVHVNGRIYEGLGQFAVKQY